MAIKDKIKGYRGIHLRIERKLGKPKQCSGCGLDDPERMYHWANISHEYLDDPSDWVRLCVPCHKVMDNPERQDQCKYGHNKQDYSYTRSNGTVECRQCRRDQIIKFRKATQSG